MTTINEFNQQRQEIINEYTKIIKGFGVGILNGLDNIVEKTKNLQPPKPTCSTCKFIKIATIAPFPFCSKGVLDVIHSNVTTSCIYHSDYGAENEA